MFETAVAVGVYHKSEGKLNINPDEDTIFQPGDQIVVLASSGNHEPAVSYCYSHDCLVTCSPYTVRD